MEQHSPILFLVPPLLSFLFFIQVLLLFYFDFISIYHDLSYFSSFYIRSVSGLDLASSSRPHHWQKQVRILTFLLQKLSWKKIFKNQSTQLFSFNQSTLIFLLVFITFFPPLNSWNYFAVYIFFRFKALIYSTPTVADLDGDGR